jgi:hypothetical protein
MTTDEMIANFKQQLEDCVASIKDLDTQINTKKEEYFKLLGAVQALELTKSQGAEVEGGVTAE